MYGSGGVYGGMVSIMPYGLVWYGIRERLGTLDRLEAFCYRLCAFRASWVIMRAFDRLGRRCSIILYACMVCR